MTVFRKIRSMIKKGLITLNRKTRFGQTSYLDTVSNYETIKPYGFDSVPLESDDPLVILLNLNGNESNKVGFEYDNKNIFEKESLNPGEVVVFNPFNTDSYCIFKNTGETDLVGTKIALGNSTTELLAEIENILDKIIIHKHASVMGPTGVPDNAADFTAIKALITTLKGTIS